MKRKLKKGKVAVGLILAGALAANPAISLCAAESDETVAYQTEDQATGVGENVIQDDQEDDNLSQDDAGTGDTDQTTDSEEGTDGSGEEQTPGEDSGENPAGDGSEDPSGDGSQDPSGDGNEDPSGDGSEDPSGDGSEDPSEDGSEDPSEDGNEDPAGEETEDPEESFTGLQKQENGEWYYLVDGVFQDTYTGLVKHTTGTWYYVEKGMARFNTTGLVKHVSGSWYYVKAGRMQSSFRGFVKHTSGTWYYIEGGKMQSNYTGLGKHTTGTWYYTVKGKMQGDYTGLAKHTTGTWYYVELGRWIPNFSGMVEYNGKYYPVRNGKKAGSGKTVSQMSTSELREAAQTIAKWIAADAKDYSSDKWEQAAYAAALVSVFCEYSEYTTEGKYYREAWGPFVVGEYSCAGATRATGMVLDYLGISWTHANANQWTHQWCNITINGVKGWADGQIGEAGIGEYPYV